MINHNRSRDYYSDPCNKDLAVAGVRSTSTTSVVSARRSRQIVLLAPPSEGLPGHTKRLDRDPVRHDHLLAQAQRLRAKTYLRDGAIKPWQLSADDRFVQHGDDASWHLLVLDGSGVVAGCARYRPHSADTTFEELGVSDSALASDGCWGPALRQAIEAEMKRARRQGFGFVECGGWALAESIRCSFEAVRIVLCMYALARMFRGVLGITTATKRHHSSTILQRMGGRRLQVSGTELPSYFDPQYNCEMEILGFDSSAPNEKFEDSIAYCQLMLSTAPVIQARQMPRFFTYPVASSMKHTARWAEAAAS
jgi:hypothetical protein